MNRFEPEIAPVVLLVDDDDDVRTTLAFALRRARFAVLEASNGGQALETIERSHVDVVVCDLGMPDMSGFDVARALRGRPETSTLPFLMMTGSGDANSIIEGLESGADDFLAKPVRVDELVARVHAHLRTHSAWTEVVEAELHKRTEVVRALGRITLSTDPEGAAEAIVAELAERTSSPFVGVLQVVSPQRLQPLARFKREEGVVRGGRSLARGRSKYLIERAAAGPWLEQSADRSRDEPMDSFWHADVATTAIAPVYAGTELVAILSLAGELAHENQGSKSSDSRLLAAAIDYASVLGTMAGAAIANLRDIGEAQKRLRAMLAGRQFHPVFQPIVALEDGHVTGFEALTRFDDGAPPDIRFAEADAVGLRDLFEVAAIEEAIVRVPDLPDDTFVSVNVSPDLLARGDRRLDELIASVSRRVVLEISENAPIADYKAFRTAMQRFGDVGLAVDDAGAGWSSLRHILELRPDFVKLDITLVSDIDTDSMRQSLAAGLQYFALRTGFGLIAEGVEREAEADKLRDLGIDFGQGYLFGRPEPLA